MVSSRLIFIFGNDGSGKSSYINRKYNSVVMGEKKMVKRHFYENPVRKFARGFVDTGEEKAGKKSLNQRKRVKKMKIPFMVAYLSYLGLAVLCIKIEVMLRRKTVFVYDRSFIDELISIQVIKRIVFADYWYTLIMRFCGTAQFIFLDADTEKKFARIVVKDITKELFLEKERLYREVFSLLANNSKNKVERINTDEGK